mgnify:FL=1
MIKLILKKLSIIFIAISFTVISSVASAEITITWPSIWVGKDSKTTVIGELIDEFNAANAGSIKVVVEEQTDYDIYAQKLTAQIATGELPDIMTVGAQLLDVLHRSGKAMDLAPHINSDPHWNNVYPENALQSAMTDGVLSALPYELFVTPVTYNKKILKDAGYDEFPDNYDDFFKMCEAVTANGKVCTSQMTGKNGWTSMLWYSQALASAGGPDIYEKGLDHPAYVKAFEVMEKMYQYTTSDAIGADAGVSGGHFLNERTAVFMNGPWFIARYTSDGIPGLHENIGVAAAPMLMGGEGSPGGYVGGRQSSLAAGKQSDPAKEEAIVKFLKWLTIPENVARLSYSSGAMFIVNADLPNDMDRLFIEMKQGISDAPYVAPIFQNGIGSLAVASEFPQALSALALGDVTPEGAVEMLKDAE